jgi:hypothetical protein
LSNASEETSNERLAFMQEQRFWVERALQDGKSERGLGCLPDSRLEWLASPYDTGNDGDVVYAGTSFVKQRRISSVKLFRHSNTTETLSPKTRCHCRGSAAPDGGQTQKTAIIHRFSNEKAEEETKCPQ